MAATHLRFGLWYDFRNPTQWKQSSTQLYNDIFEQIAWGEQHGFEDVWLSEHHFIEDAYSPALLPIAAAIAARTKTIRIGTSVILMPFYNPIRLAEDAATVDVISGGRFELGVGTGYKVEEFAAFAVPSKERGGRTNEGLEIVRRLWEGETLTFKGRYFEVNNAKLTPEPIQKPRPPLWVGGFTPPALRRAAKYGDGYIGVGISKDVYERYLAELEKLGKPTTNVRLAGGKFFLIASNDPEKTWNEAADHVIYQVNEYAAWAQKAGMELFPHIRDRAHLRETGLLTVADPAGCIQIIRDCLAEAPLTNFYAWTLPPGLPTSWVQPHLELFANKVIPAFR
jgi:probable F420-dependent oxidoreductase